MGLLGEHLAHDDVLEVGANALDRLDLGAGADELGVEDLGSSGRSTMEPSHSYEMRMSYAFLLRRIIHSLFSQGFRGASDESKRETPQETG